MPVWVGPRSRGGKVEKLHAKGLETTESRNPGEWGSWAGEILCFGGNMAIYLALYKWVTNVQYPFVAIS